MISPGRDWNSKYMINQLIRTKDFSLLHHLLRNPPPSHLLHKSLNPSPPLLHKPPFPSPFPHSTLSLTSYAIHSAPLTQSTLPLICYTIHPPLICYTIHPFPPRTSCTIHHSPALPPYRIGSLRTGRFPVHCTPRHPMNCPWGNKNFTVDAPLQWNDWGTACEVRNMNLSSTLHFTPPRRTQRNPGGNTSGYQGLKCQAFEIR